MLLLKEQGFFESIIARPATNGITYNGVNVSEAMFIIKSTIMNIFSQHRGIRAQTPVL